MNATPVRWLPRTDPLTPEGVAADGERARAVVQRLLQRNDGALGKLRGAAAPDLLLLLGSKEDLPWLPGLTWLGRDPRMPNLYVPTTLEPDYPPDLVESAFRQKYSRLPLAVLPGICAVVALDDLRRLDRSRLEMWLRGEL